MPHPERREEEMRRRDFIGLFGSASAVIAALISTASAQFMPGINLAPDARPLTPEEQEKRKAVDDAYQSAIRKVPDKKKPADPWGDIRPSTTTSSKRGQNEY
jgi:hypothetical protein